MSHLFAGFRERFGTLLSIGLIYLGITIAVTLVVGVVTGAGMWTLVGSGTDPEAMAGMGLTLALGGLIVFALLLPVFMALWFAPALAMFHQQGPAEAMKASFVACLKNVVPFLRLQRRRDAARLRRLDPPRPGLAGARPGHRRVALHELSRHLFIE